MKAFVEHVALFVTNLDWHLDFFHTVLGMEVREEQAGPPRQAWLHGGLQLIEAPKVSGPAGQLAHLGIFVQDQNAALAAAANWGAVALPRGPNWLRLQSGLELEILQEERPGAIEAALSVKPRL